MNYPNSYLRAYNNAAMAYSDAKANGDDVTAEIMRVAATHLFDLLFPAEGE